MNQMWKGIGFGVLLGTSSAFGQENGDWWLSFDDPQLTDAIDIALSANADLAAARARGTQAKASVFQQATGSLPQVSFSANTNLAPTKTLGFGMGFQLPGSEDEAKTFTSGSANLNASWNVDLFGQNGALIHAADREAKAMRADVESQALNVAIGVTHAYWDAVVSERYLALAEEQVSAQVSLLEAVSLRYADSDAGALDVLQQRQQVASTRVQVPQRRIQVRMAREQLAALMGQSSGQEINKAMTLPHAPAPVEIARLESAIRKRPDIVAMERRVQAAKSRQWSAWAAALPTVGVSAQTGIQFFDKDEWSSQNVWGAGTTISLPIFMGGRTYGGIRKARGGVLEAEARLRGTELNATQQVQVAWVRDSEQQALLQAYTDQLQAANQAWELAQEQVKVGLTPYLNAQSALARKQQAEIAALQGHRDALGARLSLIQSLGGIQPQEETP